MQAGEYRRRLEALAAWNAPPDSWQCRSAGDVAFTLEALGVAPDDFARVLELASTVTSQFTPAALADACKAYRVGLVRLADCRLYSGQPIGAFQGCAVLVWTKSESDIRQTHG